LLVHKGDDMTGEMCREEVTRDAYPIHFAIADALDGRVEPFDQYQGPYVATDLGKLWLIDAGGGLCRIYDEQRDRQSPRFGWTEAEWAVCLVHDRRRWRKIKREG
jgi:hypothetical protein